MSDAPTTYVPLQSEPLRVRAWRFARALMVGAAATLSDFLTLTTLIHLAAVQPQIARAPALFVGALVQFVGNRVFTFRATDGSLARHARLFFLFEAAGYAANLGLFALLVRRLPRVPPELLSFVGTFLVFVAFSYPVRRLVIFRLMKNEIAAVP